jgi:hypothetical protein
MWREDTGELVGLKQEYQRGSKVWSRQGVSTGVDEVAIGRGILMVVGV